MVQLSALVCVAADEVRGVLIVSEFEDFMELACRGLEYEYKAYIDPAWEGLERKSDLIWGEELGTSQLL